MSERYFLKSKSDAPEKGPYTLEAIKESQTNGMLKNSAIVRSEIGGATTTVGELLEIPTPRERARSEAAKEYAAADMDRNVRHEQSQRSTHVAIGLGMIIVGFGLTAATYNAASGGGRYVVFTGLIAFGFVRVLRGAASR